MSDAPLIHIEALSKTYPGGAIKIRQLSVHVHETVVLSGLDEAGAEVLIHLITGAALPDEGRVSVGGRDTREIATDTEWLESLNAFGLVTHRAVLLDALSVAANIALPLTLAIEPMSDETKGRVESEGREVGLGNLDVSVQSLSEAQRLRLHLARAVINGPPFVLLERPTSRLGDVEQSRQFGETLRQVSDGRFGWLAVTDDDAFGAASGGTRLRLDPATGEIKPVRSGWRRLFG